MPRHRFPQWVYRVGSEPDPRFSLANERTFLAWIRTSLGLLAAGIALEVLGLGLHEGLRLAAALVLLVSGVSAAPLAFLRWARAERALREGKPLPTSVFGVLVMAAVAVGGALVVLAILLA